MADYRTVKTAMWAQDEWFMDLPIDAKLLWLYLFTNAHASVAGIYKLPIRTICNETGIDQERVEGLLRVFAQKGKAKHSDGTVWVVKMREHQATTSPLVEKRIAKDVALLPDTPLKREYLKKYGTDRVSIGYSELDSETETETETEGEPATASRSQMARQYEAVLGMVPTASYPEMTVYMDKLINASAADWWTLALQETTGARRPGWQYMKSVLEAWLAAGKPSVNGTGKSSTDPDNRPRVKAPPPDALAAADARQAAYERQVAEELARAGRLA